MLCFVFFPHKHKHWLLWVRLVLLLFYLLLYRNSKLFERFILCKVHGLTSAIPASALIITFVFDFNSIEKPIRNLSMIKNCTLTFSTVYMLTLTRTQYISRFIFVHFDAKLFVQCTVSVNMSERALAECKYWKCWHFLCLLALQAWHISFAFSRAHCIALLNESENETNRYNAAIKNENKENIATFFSAAIFGISCLRYCSYCYARALCSASRLFAIVCDSNFVFVSNIVVVAAVGNSISSQFGVAVDK